jgi:hypothetical protein
MVAGAAGRCQLRLLTGLRDELGAMWGLNSFMGLNILEYQRDGRWTRSSTPCLTPLLLAATFTSLSTATNLRAFTGLTPTKSLLVWIAARDSLIRAVATDSESGSEFNLIADDQYSIRQNKIGYFGSVEEGRVVLDNRVLVGCAIDR